MYIDPITVNKIKSHLYHNIFVSQRKNTYFAVFELLASLNDVRDKEGQTTVIIEPPYVNISCSFLCLELLNTCDNIVFKPVSICTSVHSCGHLARFCLARDFAPSNVLLENYLLNHFFRASLGVRQYLTYYFITGSWESKYGRNSETDISCQL